MSKIRGSDDLYGTGLKRIKEEVETEVEERKNVTEKSMSY